MRYAYLALFFFFFIVDANSQIHQIDIPRVEQMPDAPSPYVMRDWKSVATQYDALVFDQALTGTHLPLISLKSSGKNYPDLKPIQLDTYVGTISETQAEAINIIPAIVSASLMGVDKTNQNGMNWVEKIKDFYNSANGQNVYLNGTSSTSGNDWWYDTMPNVFFYQAFTFYPEIPDFEDQFISVADRWLEAVYAMGGKTTPWSTPFMNYRGWYLSSMTGNATSVKEPEAAGSIAWILYQAYSHTSDRKYLEGAQLCIDYLSGLNSNPAYELQLPYGTLTAAKLNATLGANYDIEKILNWSFNRGDLRGWGTIVGSWDGKDVSGLVGEANDAGNDYAFMMNGYQQVAALAPVAKYDKRFARALAKWILNVANASRLYYPQYLESAKQDDYNWSTQYDPGSVIGYEALKENLDGKALYGTGDAKRNGWAATNLALYGSSHVGYLAAVVEPTIVEKILKLDLNRTDFFAENSFPTFLLYNPYEETKMVMLNEGAGSYRIYDAISETVLAENVSGDIALNINPDEVIMLTFLPAGSTITVKGNKLYVDEHVIDYHYGYDFNPVFRIKSLAADKTTAAFGDDINLFATVENAVAPVSYKWYVNDVLQSETETANFSWTAPGAEGVTEMKVEAISNATIVKDSLSITVVPVIPIPPAIIGITADQKYYLNGATAKIVVAVRDAQVKHFTYNWIVPSGNFEQQDSLITWTTPAEGVYLVRCIVTNEFNLTSETSIDILVKSESDGSTSPLAYYPLNVDVNDYSGNDFNGKVEGTQQADDALGVDDYAYRFTSGSDVIYVDNKSELNFRDAITLSFWMSPGSAGHEAFLISHGSWEERWKISITPDKKLRWTVKTENGVRDLDSKEALTNNEFIHVTCVYTGYSMELFIDGELDGFIAHDGKILTTGKQITFGQKDYSDRGYYYNGVLDEIRIYDKTLQPDEIIQLKELWHEEPVAPSTGVSKKVRIYPNPTQDGAVTVEHRDGKILTLDVFTPDGRSIPVEENIGYNKATIRLYEAQHGVFLIRVTTSNGVTYSRIIRN
ncbi:MAG TPA: LamG-like jellyroll fold domain-containing protein [Cyclobacteriaceae bacterium]|nr:LamG-like jellyroll fold domain-containing protein [Cyclobacteriaceae bacterium]